MEKGPEDDTGRRRASLGRECGVGESVVPRGTHRFTSANFLALALFFPILAHCSRRSAPEAR